jgi:hypothetical protein
VTKEKEIREEKIDPKYIYQNKMFPSDMTIVKEIKNGKIKHQMRSNGLMAETDAKTFLHYWRKTKMLVKANT